MLKYNENNKIDSSLLKNVTKAGSSNEILRDVLGITSTFPLWATSKIESIINDTISRGISEESLRSFREKMECLGFDNVIPSALNQLFEGNKK